MNNEENDSPLEPEDNGESLEWGPEYLKRLFDEKDCLPLEAFIKELEDIVDGE